ncbi:MAG TPA: flagellar basal body-associated FliL family protein [Solirubrobacteraceae bacterium]|nr:flagellar basal body-associated FliL family protein [Solirubrobacteraceae bacterium]
MSKLLAKRTLLLALAVPVALGGGMFLLSHPKKEPPKKITGTIYVMPQTFLLNLDEGHYAKLSVALDLAPQQSDGASGAEAPTGSGESAGTLPEEALVREIVVNAVTGQSGSVLVSASGRRAIRRRILDAIVHETDLKVQSVLFPELTVQ